MDSSSAEEEEGEEVEEEVVDPLVAILSRATIQPVSLPVNQESRTSLPIMVGCSRVPSHSALNIS